LRIAVYIGDLDPQEGGGYTFQDDIIRYLIKQGNEGKHSFIIYSNLDRKQITERFETNLIFIQVPYSKNRLKFHRFVSILFRDIFFLRNILGSKNWFERNLRDQRVDFVWFVTPHFLPVDIPYAYTIWDLQHRMQPWFPEVSANGRWRFREESYSNVIPRASALIIGNKSGMEELKRFYNVPTERVLLVPHPTPSFSLEDTGNNIDIHNKYHIPENYLFYPAQFWGHKNHVNLLLSVKLLKERDHLVFPVVFVGSDRGNLQHVRNMAGQLGLVDQVHFLGFVPREDLICLYKNALALTYLTYFGPENLPPLEAFALKCPVIASLVPGAEEQFGDAAVLVNPIDVEAIAAGIKSIYESPELRMELIERGQARAIKWTAKDYVNKLVEYFDEFESVRRCWP